MSEVVKRLLERRANLVEQMREVAERAVDEGRDMTAEEDRQFTETNAEVDALQNRADAMLEGEKRAKEIEDSFANLAGKPKDRQERQEWQGSAELRAFVLGEPGSPRAYEVKPDGPVNFRDLTKSPATAGGNTVPQGFYDRLVAHLIETAGILEAGATVLNTAGGETIPVPKTTAHSAALLTAEAAAIAESDPAFGVVNLGAFKYAVLMQASRELLSDTGVDLEGYLAMQAGRALGNAFGTHAITGDGTAKPRGLTIDTTVGVTGATAVAGVFSADNLIDLFFSVIAPYRKSSSCAWMMRDATIANVRKLKTTEGQYLWQPGLQVATADTILGKPVVTDPNVAAVALSAKSVVFGDLSQYFVRLAGGIRFERSEEFAFNSDLVTFRAIMRADGALVDTTGAVKHFVGGAT